MIRLISAVPISIVYSLIAARDALFHLFQLGANAAVVNRSCQLDQQTAEQVRLDLFLQDDFFTGQSAQALAQLLDRRRFESAGANYLGLDAPFGFVE